MAGWANSDRRSRLPKDWAKRRRRILRRDPVCTCRGKLDGCEAHPGVPCFAAAAEVDHLERGDDHRDENLGGKCSPCHFAKTLAERRNLNAERRRPAERHPGLIGD